MVMVEGFNFILQINNISFIMLCRISLLPPKKSVKLIYSFFGPTQYNGRKIIAFLTRGRKLNLCPRETPDTSIRNVQSLPQKAAPLYRGPILCDNCSQLTSEGGKKFSLKASGRGGEGYCLQVCAGQRCLYKHGHDLFSFAERAGRQVH